MLKKYLLYLVRWQLSTPILASIVYYIKGIPGAIIANFIGGLLFFWVDKFIFKNKKGSVKRDRLQKET